MEPVFKNAALQKQFERKGYVLFSQLVDAEGVNELRNLFDKHQAHFEGPFHTSHFSSNVPYKQEVHHTIAKVVFEQAGKHLHNFVPLFGNFMIKNPNADAAMDLHADWTYVDETKFSSVAVWMPLIDVDANNGCFGLIEGSHRITNLIRGPLIRQSSRQRDPIWEKKYGQLIPLKAGDAIFYNHRLLHYSPANKSPLVRPALNLTLAPAQAQWIHYCMPEGTNEIKLYQVPDTSFYLNYTHFQTPQTNTLVETLPLNTVKYIDSVMEKFRLVRWANRIKDLFKD